MYTPEQSGCLKKNAPALRAVCKDTGQFSTQIKAVTNADCSPITIKRYLREKGLKNKTFLREKKRARLDFARDIHGTLKGGKNVFHLFNES